MKKERNMTLLMVIIVLLVVVTGVSLVYAAYSQQLNIVGTATVKGNRWEIKFTDLSEEIITGSAKEITVPSLQATKIGDYKVELSKPNSSISYTFNVENTGTFDATLATLTKNEPTCKETDGGTSTDATNVCKYLEYKLVYSGDNLNGHSEGDEVKQSDTLDAGQKASMKLTLTYKDVSNSEDLPKNDVEISNLDITLVYQQK